MSFTFKGRVFLTDDEGFMQDFAQWDEQVMYEIARLENIQLTDDHIVIIKAVQEYYRTYNTTPPMRSLIAYLKKIGKNHLASSIELAKLFPQGAAKMSAKLAGLKKPIKCI